VDRFVTFLYTGRYAEDTKSVPRILNHATHIPSPSTPESYDIPDLDTPTFHLHMCALAEDLEYPALYDYAHRQLSIVLIKLQFLNPAILANVIAAAFADGKDKAGWLRKLVVAATVVQETKHYTPRHCGALRAAVKIEAFWAMYEDVKEKSRDLVPVVQQKKGPARKERAAREPVVRTGGRVTKRGEKVGKERREEARRTAAVIKGLESMGLE